MLEEIKELPPRKVAIAQRKLEQPYLNKSQFFQGFSLFITFAKAISYVFLVNWIWNQLSGPSHTNRLGEYINQWYQSMSDLFGVAHKSNQKVYEEADIALVVLWITGIVAVLEFISNLIEIWKPRKGPEISSFTLGWLSPFLISVIIFLIVFSR
ncbi:hypothetical protein F4694_005268 [Bacillus niacini]|uniref:Uncharacterized protein n=1 Tax=Neobacillus niacini TaxID=86668 RepID=A0A852TN38_9BACI|nr:hypothetical protein [Neobacillus niacini]NYE08424.1 hypothetical protein [Neobacillus niacini]